MEENIFYDNKNDENKNKNENNNIDSKTTIENDNKNSNKDEFTNSLPSWDLEPPYEEIRRD